MDRKVSVSSFRDSVEITDQWSNIASFARVGSSCVVIIIDLLYLALGYPSTTVGNLP